MSQGEGATQPAATLTAVIVPDFAGPRPLVFEARTLFFLASWAEMFGTRGGTHIRAHVCFVGEPPASVVQLAARIRVGWSVHEPFLPDYGGFANKLRGLEAPVQSDRLLLLDADVLILGALDFLAAMDADLAAAPAGKPHVPEDQWRLIYAALGLAVPAERVVSSYGEFGVPLEREMLRYPQQEQDARSMLPYYNSGSLLVRRECGLREIWADYLRRIPAIFQSRGLPVADAVTGGDQVALAVAIQALRGQGASFELLPHAFNTRLVHFRGGARVGDTAILHAPGFAGAVRERSELAAAVRHYEERWIGAIRQGLREDPVACDHDTGQARAILQNLWHCWVREAWEN
jgi:hypothetical protein